MHVRAWLVASPLAIALATAACPSTVDRGALDPSTLPPEVAADYQVFAARCSKCHSLDRPLDRGAQDDDYWQTYVTRMRRQPGSGISVEDTAPILRFLHYSSEQVRRKKSGGGSP
jgi:hypothetical protein